MASGGETEKKEEAGVDPGTQADKKHPLQNKWSLWYFKKDSAKAWKDNLKLVTSFDTVEDFWAVYNHIKPPSCITSGCDYMLFKEGIEPMWEDKRNRQGGRWLLNFDKKTSKETVDNCWMETLMCLVGEVFEESSDEVCGAVVQMRPKGDKIAIWTANTKKDGAIMHIGRSYKEKLELHMKRERGERVSLAYQSHADTSTKTGSVSRSLHTLN